MLMMKKEGYRANQEAQERLKEICENIYIRRNASTGNAGKMERFLEDMHANRRERCEEQEISFGTEESKWFRFADIPETW